MNKHTPGPWTLDGDEVRGGQGNCFIAVASFASAYAKSGRFTKEEQANARLIAAAPELLEACKKALDFTLGRSIKENLTQIVKELNEAIAKAEDV